MRSGLVTAAVVLLAAAAVWMYYDRERRLDHQEEGTPAADGASAPFAGRDTAAVKEAFPGDLRDLLEAAGDFELMALDPMPFEAREKTVPADGHLHGYEILGRAAIQDATERRGLVEALYRAVNDSDGSVASCFNPRHGVRVKRAGHTLELVICFECHQFSTYVNGEDVGGGLLMKTGEPPLDAAFERHGLQKHRRK